MSRLFPPPLSSVTVAKVVSRSTSSSSSLLQVVTAPKRSWLAFIILELLHHLTFQLTLLIENWVTCLELQTEQEQAADFFIKVANHSATVNNDGRKQISFNQQGLDEVTIEDISSEALRKLKTKTIRQLKAHCPHLIKSIEEVFKANETDSMPDLNELESMTLNDILTSYHSNTELSLEQLFSRAVLIRMQGERIGTLAFGISVTEMQHIIQLDVLNNKEKYRKLLNNNNDLNSCASKGEQLAKDELKTNLEKIGTSAFNSCDLAVFKANYKLESVDLTADIFRKMEKLKDDEVEFLLKMRGHSVHENGWKKESNQHLLQMLVFGFSDGLSALYPYIFTMQVMSECVELAHNIVLNLGKVTSGEVQLNLSSGPVIGIKIDNSVKKLDFGFYEKEKHKKIDSLSETELPQNVPGQELMQQLQTHIALDQIKNRKNYEKFFSQQAWKATHYQLLYSLQNNLNVTLSSASEKMTDEWKFETEELETLRPEQKKIAAQIIKRGYLNLFKQALSLRGEIDEERLSYILWIPDDVEMTHQIKVTGKAVFMNGLTIQWQGTIKFTKEFYTQFAQGRHLKIQAGGIEKVQFTSAEYAFIRNQLLDTHQRNQITCIRLPNPDNEADFPVLNRTDFCCMLEKLEDQLGTYNQNQAKQIGRLSNKLRTTGTTLTLEEWAYLSWQFDEMAIKHNDPYSSDVTVAPQFLMQILEDMQFLSNIAWINIAYQKIVSRLMQIYDQELTHGFIREESWYASAGVSVGINLLGWIKAEVSGKASVGKTTAEQVGDENYITFTELTDAIATAEAGPKVVGIMDISAEYSHGMSWGTVSDYDSGKTLVRNRFDKLIQKLREDPQIKRYLSRAKILQHGPDFIMVGNMAEKKIQGNEWIVQSKLTFDAVTQRLNVFKSGITPAKLDDASKQIQKEKSINQEVKIRNAKIPREKQQIIAKVGAENNNNRSVQPIIFSDNISSDSDFLKNSQTVKFNNSVGLNNTPLSAGARVTGKREKSVITSITFTSYCEFLADPLRPEKIKNNIRNLVKRECSKFSSFLIARWELLTVQQRLTPEGVEVLKKTGDPSKTADPSNTDYNLAQSLFNNSGDLNLINLSESLRTPLMNSWEQLKAQGGLNELLEKGDNPAITEADFADYLSRNNLNQNLSVLKGDKLMLLQERLKRWNILKISGLTKKLKPEIELVSDIQSQFNLLKEDFRLYTQSQQTISSLTTSIDRLRTAHAAAQTEISRLQAALLSAELPIKLGKTLEEQIETMEEQIDKNVLFCQEIMERYGAGEVEELLHNMVMFNTYLFLMQLPVDNNSRNLTPLQKSILEFEKEFLLDPKFKVTQQKWKEYVQIKNVTDYEVVDYEVSFELYAVVGLNVTVHYQDHQSKYDPTPYNYLDFSLSAGVSVSADLFNNISVGLTKVAELLDAPVLKEIAQAFQNNIFQQNFVPQPTVSFHFNRVYQLRLFKLKEDPIINLTPIWRRVLKSGQIKIAGEVPIHVLPYLTFLAGGGYTRLQNSLLTETYSKNSLLYFLVNFMRACKLGEADRKTRVIEPDSAWKAIETTQKTIFEQLFANKKIEKEINKMHKNVRENNYLTMEKEPFEQACNNYLVATSQFQQNNSPGNYENCLAELRTLFFTYEPHWTSSNTNNPLSLGLTGYFKKNGKWVPYLLSEPVQNNAILK